MWGALWVFIKERLFSKAIVHCKLSASFNTLLGKKSVFFRNTETGSSVQSCLTLCNPIDCSMPGLPVHHQLPELTQTHVHRVGDAINHLILCHPLLLLPSIPPSIRVFSNESKSTKDPALNRAVSLLPHKIHILEETKQ